MQLPSVVPTAFVLFLSSQATARVLPQNSLGVSPLFQIHGRSNHFSEGIKRDVDAMLNHILDRRQSSPSQPASPGPSSRVTPSDRPAMNPQVWNTTTSAACMNSLMMANGSEPNPSGLSVCYNLPYLNNDTGVFQADLRLYRVAPATGNWAGVPQNDFSVGLSYKGASVSPDGNTLSKRVEHTATTERRQSGSASRQTPQVIQGFNFVGQMNAELVNNPLNLGQLREYLAPNVTLTATTQDGKSMTTVLSASDASFVNGLLVQNATLICSTLACTQAYSAISAAFVLPGTTLAIFPTGLLITSLWSLIGISFFTWGTIGRFQFREQYRRRKNRVIGRRNGSI